MNIKPQASKKSVVYKFLDPNKPFEKISNDQADHVWQNPKTGNTLAVLSECSESNDPSLHSIENDTINALGSGQVLKSNKEQFNDREALHTVSEGQVDGISVKVDTLIFKKNTCAYTLSYIARSKSFEADLATMENFRKGFIVP